MIKPHGHLFVPVWPLWHSEHGHHLWHTLRPFDQLRYTRDELLEELRAGEAAVGRRAVEHESDRSWMSIAVSTFDSCNQITLDEIQTLLLEHGFGLGRVEVMTNPLIVPGDLQSVPLSRRYLSGVKLIAWRKP